MRIAKCGLEEKLTAAEGREGALRAQLQVKAQTQERPTDGSPQDGSNQQVAASYTCPDCESSLVWSDYAAGN